MSEWPELSITVAESGDRQTVLVRGEIDIASAPQLDAAVSQACAGAGGLVVIDLRQLTFIDSSGLQVIMSAYQRCLAQGHELRIVRGKENVQRLFALTGMSDVLPFCDADELELDDH